MRPAVVVLARDEEAELPGLLDHLAGLPGSWEVVLADGGSVDATRAIARERGVPVVRSEAGRAAQANAGAAATTGDPVLFLHADSRLPGTAHAGLRRALHDPRVAGGNFALRFDGDGVFPRFLGAVYAAQRRLGFFYGDSTIWCRRTVFEALGGFAELPIMDDYDFARRLRRAGHTACVPGPARTSARRWETLGVPRTLLVWWGIRWLYVLGVPPRHLAGLYRAVR